MAGQKLSMTVLNFIFTVYYFTAFISVNTCISKCSIAAMPCKCVDDH